MTAVRIAHATDIHWFCRPSLRHLSVKRLLGTANLYGRGRRHEFDEQVQARLVGHLLETRPDLVLITGDLTAQALPEEFVKAKRMLQPLLAEIPTVIIPGNHDLYAPDALRDRLFHHTFERWAGREDPEALIRASVGPVTILGLDPNRPLWFGSSGRVPEAQLHGLAKELANPALAGRPVVLAVHYPPVDRSGHVYDDAMHGLENARALIDVLDRAPNRPVLIACGHVHHGFRSRIALSDGTEIAVLNCGSSGYAFQPERRRAAATATYTIAADGSVGYERFLYDGAAFSPEPGGAFATGR